MKIQENTRNVLVKKLEHRFKNSDNGKLLIGRIIDNDEFTESELITITKKLEYGFKQSEKGIAIIKELIGE